MITDNSNPTVARVTNSSTQCSYRIGLAIYRKFDGNIDNQELFDYQLAVIGPGRTLELTVDNPPCAYQADVFYGDINYSFAGGVRYATRLLDAFHGNGTSYCTLRCGDLTVPTVTPTPTPTNTSIPATATKTPPAENTAIAPTVTKTKTPTNTPVPPTATKTGTPTITPTATRTPTPTPGCVVNWSGTLGSDQAVCLYEPQWITVTGSVTLTPATSNAYLQTDWLTVSPTNGNCPAASAPCTSDHYMTQGITSSTNFSVEAWWPGIRPGDSIVEIHVGANILDCQGNPIHDGIGRDIYWYPYVCPPPTATPTPRR